MGRARLLYYSKEELIEGFILEMKMYEVNDWRYEDNVKYSLIFVSKEIGRKVLMDNHYPKGHHVHFDNYELDYEYTNNKQLIRDFKFYVYKHFGIKL